MKNVFPKKKSSFGYGIFPETDELPEVSVAPFPPKVQPEPQPEPPYHNDRFKTRETPAITTPKKVFSNKGISYTPLGPIGKKGEPLSLAEVISWERTHGLVEPDYEAIYEKLNQGGDATYLNELKMMSVPQLIAEARRQKTMNPSEQSPEQLSRQELIFQMIRRRTKENGLLYGEGTLEILPDQFGFLRSSDHHYISCPDDIYISPSQIRRFGLRKGCIIAGQIRPPKECERYFALLRVEAINHEEPYQLNNKPVFESLTPVHPNTPMRVSSDNDIELKMIDRLIPIGFGQRGLIISPPRCGKTVLIRKMASAVLKNYPELYVFVLLLDERPEEATEMIRYLKSPRSEVVCAFFDEEPIRRIDVSEIVFEKAKRMVEYGKNVCIFLDSITRLSQAVNTDAVSDADPSAANLTAAKKMFGSARRTEGGGSLTILATALIETDNPADQAVYRQFQGTGNLEIRLSRILAEKRIWPAIDIHKSGMQHEEYLFSESELLKNAELRRKIAEMTPEDAINYLREYCIEF
jgi:transcription termination factor Rho